MISSAWRQAKAWIFAIRLPPGLRVTPAKGMEPANVSPCYLRKARRSVSIRPSEWATLPRGVQGRGGSEAVRPGAARWGRPCRIREAESSRPTADQRAGLNSWPLTALLFAAETGCRDDRAKGEGALGSNFMIPASSAAALSPDARGGRSRRGDRAQGGSNRSVAANSTTRRGLRGRDGRRPGGTGGRKAAKIRSCALESHGRATRHEQCCYSRE